MPHQARPPHEIHDELMEHAKKVHQYLVDHLHENDTMIGGGRVYEQTTEDRRASQSVDGSG